MRYVCYFCHKSVTSELPSDSVIRAALVCPECLLEGKVVLKDDADTNPDKRAPRASLLKDEPYFGE
jgi:DNA-directed RNA polymerase subunit RPC12/RpoP